MTCAANLRAERRWVMTGTPTPGTSPASDVRHLLPLLQILRLQPYASNQPLWRVRSPSAYSPGLGLSAVSGQSSL